MSTKSLNTRIVLKHDTSTNWAQATTFVPKLGELIIYDDLQKFKLGDGTTSVIDLKFIEGVEGYYYNSQFYFDSAHTNAIPAKSGIFYIDLTESKLYRYINNAYVTIGGGGSSIEVSYYSASDIETLWNGVS